MKEIKQGPFMKENSAINRALNVILDNLSMHKTNINKQKK